MLTQQYVSSTQAASHWVGVTTQQQPKGFACVCACVRACVCACMGLCFHMVGLGTHCGLPTCWYLVVLLWGWSILLNG